MYSRSELDSTKETSACKAGRATFRRCFDFIHFPGAHRLDTALGNLPAEGPFADGCTLHAPSTSNLEADDDRYRSIDFVRPPAGPGTIEAQRDAWRIRAEAAEAIAAERALTIEQQRLALQAFSTDGSASAVAQATIEQGPSEHWWGEQLTLRSLIGRASVAPLPPATSSPAPLARTSKSLRAKRRWRLR